MAWMSVIGTCCNCGQLFSFNPDRVPSIRVSRKDGKWMPDPTGTREPVCETCIHRANQQRKQRGLEPFMILPGAYDISEEGEL